ncbi:hypothetical protein [Methylibium sp.]|uniref:hypothetical protein n=1 Tax=Methylibium sp. TaxID=2067992 RepID=UPI003D0F47AB
MDATVKHTEGASVARPLFLRRPRIGRAVVWLGLLALPAYGLVVELWMHWSGA